VETLEGRTLLAGFFSEFPIAPAFGTSFTPVGISASPGNTLEFSSQDGQLLGRIHTSGSIENAPIPLINGKPTFMEEPPVTGPDGTQWFAAKTETVVDLGPCMPPSHTGCGTRVDDIYFIVHQTPAGLFATATGASTTYVPGPTTGWGFRPSDLVVGPGGGIWYLAGFAQIGSAGGKIFSVPAQLGALAAGADGNLWFTEPSTNHIGRMTPTGSITEFAIPSSNSGATEIAGGPDQALYFTEPNVNKIGRISLNGTISEFAIPTTHSGASGIVAGPDGYVYFTETGSNKIGRMTPTGVFAELAIPTRNSGTSHLALGSDGNVYFTETSADQIGRLNLSALNSVVGSLSPGSDTGASHSDGITSDTTPTFVGFAAPGTRVQLVAMTPSRVSPLVLTSIPMGEATASPGDGSWTLTCARLPEGVYTVIGRATDTAGHTTSSVLPIGVLGVLVIDTIGPRVSAAALDPGTGQIRIGFSEAWGMDATRLVQAGNYSLLGLVGWPRKTGVVVTSVSIDARALPGSSQSVTLTINGGQRIRAGELALGIASAGIKDLAGNPLDGEFSRFLPSGNGRPGGDFLARFAICRQRASRPRPIGRG
jgi:streptogramin lyase